MSILVLCPSRGNPSALLAAFRSFSDTVSGDTPVFAAVVDHDDPALPEYLTAAGDTGMRILVAPEGETGCMNSALNWAAIFTAERSDPDDLIGFIGDDHRFRTPGWDVSLSSEAAETGGGFFYGDDLFQGARLPTQVFVSAKAVSALGWLGLPGAKHLYLDNAWLTLGEMTGRLFYMPWIVIEHMHPAAGKAEWDAGHVRVNDRSVYEHDFGVFTRWLDASSDDDAEKVSAVFR